MSLQQPQTPELSVKALVAWLAKDPATEDPDAEYIYQDPARCLLGYYLTAHDAEQAISEAAYEQFLPDAETYRAIAAPKPHTFQAALARAEQLLALPAPAPAFDPPVQVEQGEPAPAEGADH